MITLITGAPGSGKSLLLVDEFLTKAKEEGRAIVADGIPELVIEHEPAETVDKWTKSVEDASSQTGSKLVYTFPQGSLVVIDECQRVFRPRRAGSTVPAEVAAFETHRHQGLDFVLITQHPGLLDANVRRLVGRHLHIRDLGFLGRWVYEFPEATEPDRYKSAAVKRKWSLPKKSFSLYKSSSLHVKPVRGFPTALKVLAVAVVLLVGGIYYASQSISKKLNPQETSVAAPGQSIEGRISQSVVEYDPVKQTLARHPNYPESAPMFDALRQVKAMPVVVGCIQLPKRCACQTQQGTDAGVSEGFCRSFLENPPFDAYRDPVQVAKPERIEEKPVEKPASSGGSVAGQSSAAVPSSLTPASI